MLTKDNWIIKGRSGASSKTIWGFFHLGELPSWPCPPSDPSDFLRCYWLLKLAPEWKSRLPELAAACPRWYGLVSAWDELESMLEEAWPESCASGGYSVEPPALAMYARMRVIQEASPNVRD